MDGQAVLRQVAGVSGGMESVGSIHGLPLHILNDFNGLH